jgi:hypothetical protein
MSNRFRTATDCPADAGLDPLQHVNFVLGMVLGKEDLEQEFAYLAGHDHWLAREALGYGTLSGLHVSLRDDEVRVEPGVALTPKGQLVRVAPAQCARIGEWLAGERQRGELARLLGSPPTGSPLLLPVYVVLCYAECPGHEVLIPGEPCRSEDDLMAPSRIADDFRLELRLAPPEQREEDALRAFVHRLRRGVEIGAGPSSHGIPEFLDWLRGEMATGSPEVVSPDLLPVSSPLVTAVLIAREAACAYLAAALRLWVTELRPLVQADFFGASACGCDGRAPPVTAPRDPEECLLLAELRVPLDVDARLLPGAPIGLDETRRPVLGSLRLLQEWLLCGPAEAGEAAPVPGSPGGSLVLTADAETVPPTEPADAEFDPATGNIHFRIPRGDAGSPGITTATAVTLPPGQNATAAILPGTTTLQLGIPQGATGGPGITTAIAVTLAPGQQATAAILPGTTTLQLGIPQGEPGQPGDAGDEYVHAPHPPGGGPPVPYHIVAAGRIGAGAGAVSCNGLRIVNIEPALSALDMAYDGYDRDFQAMTEEQRSQLIVKVLPVFAGDQEGNTRFGFVAVHLSAFEREFIRLYISRNGTGADPEFLRRLELLVEISRFERTQG